MSHPTLIDLPFDADHNAPPNADNPDQYPESLVRFFLEHYTKAKDKIFDPFMGFGTTAFVAEDMNRIPYGIEADGERFEWAAGQLTHWQNIKHDDAANIPDHAFPKMDFCITSPPYMPATDKWNPLYGGDPDHAGYDAYLNRLGFIFERIAGVMKKNTLVIVQADNLQGKTYTPLIRDFSTQISRNLKPEGETIIRWTGERPTHLQNNTHTHCLIFKK